MGDINALDTALTYFVTGPPASPAGDEEQRRRILENVSQLPLTAFGSCMYVRDVYINGDVSDTTFVLRSGIFVYDASRRQQY